jgi:transcriptional regulator with XRE-family HTH domain
MDMLFVVRQRLEELGLEQKDLAAAAEVTESYVSQLLTRKKAPPAPERTDIYFKFEKFLKLPEGRLSRLAELQRKEELKRKVVDPPAPLFKEVRELILQKCVPDKAEEVRAIFERQPFGELERLVTQKILDVVKDLAREELDNQDWLHEFARLSALSYEEVRVKILEFLDTDVFHISTENCVTFLDPLIETWDIDLKTFGIEILLNRRLVAGRPRRFDFVERGVGSPVEVEPGLEEFLDDPSLSGDVTEKEIAFLKRLRFNGARPTALYFYREVQSLRDPLHFRDASAGDEHARRPAARSKRKPKKGSR